MKANNFKKKFEAVIENLASYAIVLELDVRRVFKIESGNVAQALTRGKDEAILYYTGQVNAVVDMMKDVKELVKKMPAGQKRSEFMTGLEDMYFLQRRLYDERERRTRMPKTARRK